MSYNGSEKEYIFNLYEAYNKEILEKVINIKLNDMVLERYYKGLKIDLYGIEANKGLEVYVETQLLKSDNRHKAKVLALIDRMEKGIIVWQSIEFSSEHIEEVIRRIKEADKLINFFAVKINSDVYPILEELNCNIHILNVIDNLGLLDAVQNPIAVVKTYKNIDDNIGKYRKDGAIDIRWRENTNKKLLKELRQRIYYFPTFHRQKSRLENRILTFGFGKSGIQMFMSLQDRRNRAFVEIQFSENNRHIFDNSYSA